MQTGLAVLVRSRLQTQVARLLGAGERELQGDVGAVDMTGVRVIVTRMVTMVDRSPAQGVSEISVFLVLLMSTSLR